MAATEAPLTWSGISGLMDMQSTWSEEDPVATMSARLPAMTWPAPAKDAALEDLQRQLQAALQEAEHGRAREAALLLRAQKSEAAEEALASQMAELEAEAFTRITETNKLLAAAVANHAEPIASSQLSIQVKELDRRLQAALQEAAAWARRCEILEEEGRVTAFQRRAAEIAEEAEKPLASQIAEPFTAITENKNSTLIDERCQEEAQPITSSHVAELERQLAKAEEALEAAHAKLRQAEEKNCSVEKRLAQVAQEGEKTVTLKRKQGGDTVLSVSLEELAGFVKLNKLWNPSCLLLTKC